MKKTLVLIMACLSGIVMFAQDQLHWTPKPVENTYKIMSCTCVLQIDGEEQKNPNLEIGVFSNDGECRGAKLPLYRAKSDQWIYQIVIKGDEGLTYTFKIYDHESNQELTLTPPATSITYEENARLGNLKSPYVVNFTSGKKD